MSGTDNPNATGTGRGQTPMGLVVLAVLNFVLAFFCLFGLVYLYAMPELGSIFTGTEVLLKKVGNLLALLLLVISGIGFLRLNYVIGYLGGIVYGLVFLSCTLVFGIYRNFESFGMQVPGMIHPVILLILLPSKYRKVFKRDEISQGLSDE